MRPKLIHYLLFLLRLSTIDQLLVKNLTIKIKNQQKNRYKTKKHGYIPNKNKLYQKIDF